MTSPPGTTVGRLKIKVLPDVSDFRRDLADDLRRIENELGALEIKVKADLDENSFRIAAARAKALVGDIDVGLKAGKINVKLDVDAAQLLQDVIRAIEFVQRFGPTIGIKVIADLDEESFRLAALRAKRILDDIDVKVRGSGGGGFGRGGIIGLLTNPGVIAAAVTLAVAAISPLVGALFVAGGAAVAIGLAFAPIILGIQGAADEVKNNLSPQLKGLPVVLEPLVGKIVAPLVDSLNRAAPNIEAGFTKILEKIAPITQDIADRLNKAVESGQIDRIFENVANFLDRIDKSDAFGKLTQFFLDFAEKGTEALPDSFTSFADGVERAGRKIDELIKDGTVDQAIEDFDQLAASITTVAVGMGYLVQVSTFLNDGFTFDNVLSSTLLFGLTGFAISSLNDELLKARASVDSWSEALTLARDENERFSASVDTYVSGVLGRARDANERFSASVDTYFIGVLDRAQAANSRFSASVDTYISGVLDRARGANDRFSASVDATFSRAVAAAGRLADGFQGAVDRAVGFVQSLPGRITGALSGVSLFSIGSSIVGSLISGIESRFGGVQATLGKLTSLIPSWKGPEARDLHLLDKPADDIVTGFRTRIEGQFGAIKQTFQDFPIGSGTQVGSGTVPAQRGPMLQQVFQVDPRTDGGYVEQVSSRAAREGNRILSLRYRRV